MVSRFLARTVGWVVVVFAVTEKSVKEEDLGLGTESSVLGCYI